MSHQTINWKDGYVANTLGHLSSLYLQFSNLGLLLGLPSNGHVHGETCARVETEVILVICGLKIDWF